MHRRVDDIGRRRDLGEALREPLKALKEWSPRHTKEVLAARGQYDTRAGQAS